MSVGAGVNGVVAKIDDEWPMRLIALSPDKYVTRDGNVAMEFNRGPDGDEMLRSYVPDPRVADVIVVSAPPGGSAPHPAGRRDNSGRSGWQPGPARIAATGCGRGMVVSARMIAPWW